jgi:hypothetical protein
MSVLPPDPPATAGKPKIYLTGYTLLAGPDHLAAIADELNALVVDIRYAARSRAPHWNKGPLTSRLGHRYAWAPAFGNRNYKGDGPVEIADYAEGLAWLKLRTEAAIILLCACRDAHTCHRTTVGAMLAADGYDVQELPLANPRPRTWQQESLL